MGYSRTLIDPDSQIGADGLRYETGTAPASAEDVQAANDAIGGVVTQDELDAALADLGGSGVTQQDIDDAIDALIGDAPGALDTLNELAAAIGDDADFAAAVTTSLAGKVAKGGDTMTGALQVPAGTSGAPGLQVGEADVGVYRAFADILGLTAGGVQALLSANGLALGSGIFTAPVLRATGLTGATADARYVGATASGPPLSGTFAVGNWIVDQTGRQWMCISAGSPGTWTQMGAGVTLAYDDTVTTSDFTGATTFQDLDDPVSITFPCPPGDFFVVGGFPFVSINAAGGKGQLRIISSAAAVYATDTFTSPASGDTVSRVLRSPKQNAARLGVAVGDSLTFNLQYKTSTGANTITATAAGNGGPYIQAVAA